MGKPARGLRIALLAVAVAVGAGSAVVVGASRDGSTGRELQPHEVPPPRAQVLSESDAHRQLAVLRRPRTSADAMPPALRSRVGGDAAGMNAGLSRRVSTQQGDLFVAPAADGVVCLVHELGPTGCGPVDDVAAGSFLMDACIGRGPDGAVAFVAGLLPDGAAGVRRVGSSGSAGVERVENVFVLSRADAAASRAIEWKSGDATRRVPLQEGLAQGCGGPTAPDS